MIARFVSTAPAAALVTGGLFLGMIGLIHTDFVPRERAANTEFDIAPVIEDIEIVRRTDRVEPVSPVETPPPPPRIDIQSAEEPTVPIVGLYTDVPTFDPVTIEPTDVKLVVPDSDAQPLVRIPPRPPTNADRSGHCSMLFDVTPDGSPYNIAATCSDAVFKRPSIKAVQTWKYSPKIVDGRGVSRSGVRTRLSYEIRDERGRILPE